MQAKIHTENTRYIMEISDLISDRWAVKFNTKHKIFLKEVSEGDQINLIEIYEYNKNTSMMREAMIKTLNRNTGFVEIEAIFKF
jgi:hypothetical protein